MVAGVLTGEASAAAVERVSGAVQTVADPAQNITRVTKEMN